LNEKLGSGGGFDRPVSNVKSRPVDESPSDSKDDLGRRPLERVEEVRAEEEDGRAGKTNGGFGSGPDGLETSD
jgi:hypothetical protein